jgi:hypothetical protein
VSYFDNLMQITLARNIFLKADEIVDQSNNSDCCFFSDFDMDLFFEDQRRSFIGDVDYNNAYENTIEGNLFVGHIFDERIFRPYFKDSTFNFSIAMRKINKTIYPRVVGGKYKLDSLV